MSLTPRKLGGYDKLNEAEFKKRFERRFVDPLFNSKRESIAELATIAWKAYQESHKAPLTQKAGPGFANPDYDLSSEWIEARNTILQAQALQADPRQPTNVLLISGADRNEATCPGETSKSMRLLRLAEEVLKSQNIDVQVLDLSLITSEYGKHIHPCKGCVSTAMPLCHWPCSCYPNYSLDQTHDWMNEIYPMWARAHGIMIITPVYWMQAPSALKLMIDRMVCADGGNTDPTSTNGKDAKLAKKIEMKGWDYPRHLEGRIFSVFVHGDASGAEMLAGTLHSWLSEMRMIPAANNSSISRYIGYYEPYATSHDTLDKDKNVQAEVRNLATMLAHSVAAAREGKLATMNQHVEDPRPK